MSLKDEVAAEIDRACSNIKQEVPKNPYMEYARPIFSGTYEKNWKERAETLGSNDFWCVEINRQSESVHYIGQLVSLTPQQFEVVNFIVCKVQETGNIVTEIAIMHHLGTDGANLREILSRIRNRFRKAASKLSIELKTQAVEFVDELFPGKRRGVGYTIGHPKLFEFTGD